jgi:2'-5' RNA ligase superfamily
MQPADCLVCAFARPVDEPNFQQWPLHITIVPWFRPKTSQVELAQKLRAALKGHGPFVAIAGPQKRSRLGARKVSLLQREQWQPLHDAVLKVVQANAAPSVPFVFVGSRYRPHVTYQQTGHLHPGDSFVCDHLYVVEQKGDHKEIVGEVPLER